MRQTDSDSANCDFAAKKILLMLLPFWTPLIPPLGIASLKSYLKGHHYDVVTADANLDLNLWSIYQDYNNTLKQSIPSRQQGNFYNTAHKVLQNHAMAYLNQQDETKYRKLIKILIEKQYFWELNEAQITELDGLMAKFFILLEEYLVNLMEKEKPAILGISVYTGTLPASMFAFKFIKSKYPRINTIMGGGVFADQLSVDSPNYQLFIKKTPYIDKIIIGEGEVLFLKYLRGELNENQRVYTRKDNDNGFLDLSTVKIPDFSDFNVQTYPELATYASRSCPFQCSFCSETVQWGQFRQKEVKQVVDELMLLSQNFKYQLFLFGDSLLNPFINQLAEEINRRDHSVYWDGYLRVNKDACDPRIAGIWRKAGFYRARMGVESGSQHVLELMDKKINPEQIQAAVASLAGAGIKTTTYWVVGHPGETEADFQATLDLITEMKDSIYEAECNVFQYFVKAQVNSDQWSREYGSSLLYPEEMTEMLITQTWTINTEPSRETIFRRMCRFVEHCQKLGIPNPYTIREIYLADERWRKLHKHAVPLISDFKNKKLYINENKTLSG